jgi:hypothetical protein
MNQPHAKISLILAMSAGAKSFQEEKNLMNLTRREAQTLVLAVGVAIDKERRAIEQLLKGEVRADGLKRVIQERTQHVAELDRLRSKLIAGAN